MSNLSLNLSEDLQQFVNGQVEAGKFKGPSAYIEALIVRAKKGQDHIESLLIEGLDSGEPVLLDAQEWARIRADVADRLSHGK